MSLLLLLSSKRTAPPSETFYVLDEDGNYVTDEDGNRLIQEEVE